MLLGVPAELPGIAAALEVVFGSLEELRVVRKRLLALLWTTFKASFWAEGVAGMDSDARRMLYLSWQHHVSFPDTHPSPKHYYVTIKWAIEQLQLRLWSLAKSARLHGSGHRAQRGGGWQAGVAEQRRPPDRQPLALRLHIRAAVFCVRLDARQCMQVVFLQHRSINSDIVLRICAALL